MAESLTLIAADAAGGIYTQLQMQFGASAANVIMLILAMACYVAVIGMFWKIISRRNLFEIDWKKVGKGFIPRMLEEAKFGLEYAIVFPLATFVWFVVLTISLYFMSKTATIADMMLISISLVATTRICAYIDEDVAVEVAKTMPLALLAVFLAEPTMFSALIIEQRLSEMAALIGDALPFFLMLIVLEVVLRILFLLKRRIVPEKAEK